MCSDKATQLHARCKMLKRVTTVSCWVMMLQYAATFCCIIGLCCTAAAQPSSSVKMRRGIMQHGLAAKQHIAYCLDSIPSSLIVRLSALPKSAFSVVQGVPCSGAVP